MVGFVIWAIVGIAIIGVMFETIIIMAIYSSCIVKKYKVEKKS